MIYIISMNLNTTDCAFKEMTARVNKSEKKTKKRW
jgi:hypothetical protein